MAKDIYANCAETMKSSSHLILQPSVAAPVTLIFTEHAGRKINMYVQNAQDSKNEIFLEVNRQILKIWIMNLVHLMMKSVIMILKWEYPLKLIKIKKTYMLLPHGVCMNMCVFSINI